MRKLALTLLFLSCANIGISQALHTTKVVTDFKQNVKTAKSLSQQEVQYSNAPVDNGYVSNAHFKPRGMEHVYTITHAFLDLVQRKDVLPASINATEILDDGFWEASGNQKISQLYKVNLQQGSIIGRYGRFLLS